MSGLVLSLFPGIGLLDLAFEEEGFCVVRGPDVIWGGDIRRFHPPSGRFDGVIGGPPCQSFSQLGRTAIAQGQEVGANLIPEYERVVYEAQPRWFVMENVQQAPTPTVDGYTVRAKLLDNRLDCGGIQRRLRRFSFGTRDGRALAMSWWRPPTPAEERPTATANGAVWDPIKQRSVGRNDTAYLKTIIRDQGLPADFWIPPFKVEEAIRAVGNGVPLPMGRAVARAVIEAMRAD